MKFKSNLITSVISGTITVILTIVVANNPDVLKLKPLMANSSIVTTPEKTHEDEYSDQYNGATIVKTKNKDQTDISQTKETESTHQVAQTKETQGTDENKKDETVNKAAYGSIAKVIIDSDTIRPQTEPSTTIESEKSKPNKSGSSNSNSSNTNSSSSSYESTTSTNNSQTSDNSSSSSGNNSESTEESTTDNSSETTVDSTITNTENPEATTEPSIENID